MLTYDDMMILYKFFSHEPRERAQRIAFTIQGENLCIVGIEGCHNERNIHNLEARVILIHMIPILLAHLCSIVPNH